MKEPYGYCRLKMQNYSQKCSKYYSIAFPRVYDTLQFSLKKIVEDAHDELLQTYYKLEPAQKRVLVEIVLKAYVFADAASIILDYMGLC